nr:MAG TPA: restriction alleviation protein [Bacteriophage sp.]
MEKRQKIRIFCLFCGNKHILMIKFVYNVN